MSSFSLNISYTIIQGDVNLIDRSQTTTNMDSFNDISTILMDSFNNTTTTLTSQPSAPESPLGILILDCCLIDKS